MDAGYESRWRDGGGVGHELFIGSSGGVGGGLKVGILAAVEGIEYAFDYCGIELA